MALTLAVLTAAGVYGLTSASAAELQLGFVGGGAEGAWTRNLTSMSECLRQNSDIRATVTPTQGGMELLVKLNAGRGEFGYSYQNMLADAWRGENAFQGKQMRDLRVVGVAERLAVLHWVVSKSSGIKTLADLKGKRFAPGPIGTVARTIASGFLEKAGVLKDINVANISSSEMNAYLRDGKLDGWVWLGSVPISPVTEALVAKFGEHLDVGKEVEASGFLATNPFLVKTTIPVDAYPNMDKPITTFGLNGVLIANKDVPEDTVYRVAKVLWDNTCIDYLTKAQRSLEVMKESPLSGVVFPLHPGAAKLWREKGLDVSAVPTPEKF